MRQVLLGIIVDRTVTSASIVVVYLIRLEMPLKEKIRPTTTVH